MAVEKLAGHRLQHRAASPAEVAAGYVGSGASHCRAKRCSLGRNFRNRQYRVSSVARTHGFRAASPSGRNHGIARHMAAKAAAPDSIRPSSRAWSRVSSAARSIGHATSSRATSKKTMACRRSSRRIKAISRRQRGQPPSNQTNTSDMSPHMGKSGSLSAKPGVSQAGQPGTAALEWTLTFHGLCRAKCRNGRHARPVLPPWRVRAEAMWNTPAPPFPSRPPPGHSCPVIVEGRLHADGPVELLAGAQHSPGSRW